MPHLAGTTLGPYEITGSLGAGGMGEVYRATDTNLKRQVAIKVLPPAVAPDPDRLARFRREAEVLAALNHPNIAAIYGVERAEGTTALVMELVEGPTLGEAIETARGSGLEARGLSGRRRPFHRPSDSPMSWTPPMDRASSIAISSPRT